MKNEIKKHWRYWLITLMHTWATTVFTASAVVDSRPDVSRLWWVSAALMMAAVLVLHTATGRKRW
jgi:hypothetical protein